MRAVQYVLRQLADRRPLTSREGVTAIEYAVIAMIIVLAIAAGVTGIGLHLSNTFGNAAAPLAS